MHQYKAVLEFGKKAEHVTPSHQVARCLEDYRKAEVIGMTLKLDAVEVGRWAGFARHSVVYERTNEFRQCFGSLVASY